MRDKGVVISARNDLARVEVACLEICEGCAAKTLCLKPSDSSGLLSAKNPLRAGPGDRVELEIPESHYSRALIRLFGILIFSVLSGLVSGHLLSVLLGSDPRTFGFAGSLLGLLGGAAWVHRYFKKNHGDNLFPVITKIIRQGDSHGQA